jgi:hypothetical protein
LPSAEEPGAATFLAATDRHRLDRLGIRLREDLPLVGRHRHGHPAARLPPAATAGTAQSVRDRDETTLQGAINEIDGAERSTDLSHNLPYHPQMSPMYQAF